MYVKMVQDYVNSINSGSVPMIQNAWQSVLENECLQALEDAKKEYTASYSDYFKDTTKVFRKQDLNSSIKELRDKALSIFGTIVTVKERDEDLYNKYHHELIEFIQRKEKQLIERNSNLSEGNDTALLNTLSSILKKKLAKSTYTKDNPNDLIEDYSKMLDEFDKQSVGINRNKTLCDYLKSLNFSIYQSYNDSVYQSFSKEISRNVRKHAEFEEKEKDYKHQIETLEKRIERRNDNEGEINDEVARMEQLNKEMVTAINDIANQEEEQKEKILKLESTSENYKKELSTLELEIKTLQSQKKGCCG